MLLTLLKIRWIQLVRVIKEIGFFRVLFLIAFVIFIALAVVHSIRQPQSANYVSVIAGAGLLLIHASRKDKRFIRMTFNKSYLVFLTEYLILVFPIVVAYVAFKNWINASALLLLCLLIPRIYLKLGSGSSSPVIKFLLFPFRSNLNLKWNIKVPIRDPRMFEWISGFRRYFFIIIPVYLLVLAFSFKAYVAPAGMIFLSILISLFYFYGESHNFIELFSANYKTFVALKIKLNLMHLVVVFMPMIAIALIFQPGTWYYVFGALFIAAFIQAIAIIFKYALFAENIDLGHNSVIVSINVLCILLPFFWPLPVFMGIRYYIKAQHNLKKFLHDNY